jgi:hypothetical protein
MKKVVLFAFQGEVGCFAHVLLHALDLFEKGFEAGIVIEGAATSLIKELEEEGKPFATLYREVREKGLIDCVCEACSRKTGVLGYAKAQKLRISGEMKGHPSMEMYLREGYEILIF